MELSWKVNRSQDLWLICSPVRLEDGFGHNTLAREIPSNQQSRSRILVSSSQSQRIMDDSGEVKRSQGLWLVCSVVRLEDGWECGGLMLSQ